MSSNRFTTTIASISSSTPYPRGTTSPGSSGGSPGSPTSCQRISSDNTVAGTGRGNAGSGRGGGRQTDAPCSPSAQDLTHTQSPQDTVVGGYPKRRTNSVGGEGSSSPWDQAMGEAAAAPGSSASPQPKAGSKLRSPAAAAPHMRMSPTVQVRPSAAGPGAVVGRTTSPYPGVAPPDGTLATTAMTITVGGTPVGTVQAPVWTSPPVVHVGRSLTSTPLRPGSISAPPLSSGTPSLEPPPPAAPAYVIRVGSDVILPPSSAGSSHRRTFTATSSQQSSSSITSFALPQGDNAQATTSSTTPTLGGSSGSGGSLAHRSAAHEGRPLVRVGIGSPGTGSGAVSNTGAPGITTPGSAAGPAVALSFPSVLPHHSRTLSASSGLGPGTGGGPAASSFSSSSLSSTHAHGPHRRTDSSVSCNSLRQHASNASDAEERLHRQEMEDKYNVATSETRSAPSPPSQPQQQQLPQPVYTHSRSNSIHFGTPAVASVQQTTSAARGQTAVRSPAFSTAIAAVDTPLNSCTNTPSAATQSLQPQQGSLHQHPTQRNGVGESSFGFNGRSSFAAAGHHPTSRSVPPAPLSVTVGGVPAMTTSPATLSVSLRPHSSTGSIHSTAQPMGPAMLSSAKSQVHTTLNTSCGFTYATNVSSSGTFSAVELQHGGGMAAGSVSRHAHVVDSDDVVAAASPHQRALAVAPQASALSNRPERVKEHAITSAPFEPLRMGQESSESVHDDDSDDVESASEREAPVVVDTWRPGGEASDSHTRFQVWDPKDGSRPGNAEEGFPPSPALSNSGIFARRGGSSPSLPTARPRPFDAPPAMDLSSAAGSPPSQATTVTAHDAVKRPAPVPPRQFATAPHATAGGHAVPQRGSTKASGSATGVHQGTNSFSTTITTLGQTVTSFDGSASASFTLAATSAEVAGHRSGARLTTLAPSALRPTAIQQPAAHYQQSLPQPQPQPLSFQMHSPTLVSPLSASATHLFGGGHPVASSAASSPHHSGHRGRASSLGSTRKGTLRGDYCTADALPGFFSGNQSPPVISTISPGGRTCHAHPGGSALSASTGSQHRSGLNPRLTGSAQDSHLAQSIGSGGSHTVLDSVSNSESFSHGTFHQLQLQQQQPLHHPASSPGDSFYDHASGAPMGAPPSTGVSVSGGWPARQHFDPMANGTLDQVQVGTPFPAPCLHSPDPSSHPGHALSPPAAPFSSPHGHASGYYLPGSINNNNNNNNNNSSSLHPGNLLNSPLSQSNAHARSPVSQVPLTIKVGGVQLPVRPPPQQQQPGSFQPHVQQHALPPSEGPCPVVGPPSQLRPSNSYSPPSQPARESGRVAAAPALQPPAQDPTTAAGADRGAVRAGSAAWVAQQQGRRQAKRHVVVIPRERLEGSGAM